MGSDLSIAEALVPLEAQVAHPKQQLGHPEAQEAHHVEQKLVHEAEHRKAVARLEAFKAVSADIGPVLADVKPTAPPPTPVDEKISTRGWEWQNGFEEEGIKRGHPRGWPEAHLTANGQRAS